MYTQFIYNDGRNPFIATTNEITFIMLTMYRVRQTGSRTFLVEKRILGKRDYNTLKNALRDLAIDWQISFDRFDYSLSELNDWQNFFEQFGKRYGLLTEFRENAICQVSRPTGHKN